MSSFVSVGVEKGREKCTQKEKRSEPLLPDLSGEENDLIKEKMLLQLESLALFSVRLKVK